MNSQGGLSLSKKDLIKFEVVEGFRAGKYSRELSAAKLDLCERSITRIATRVAKEGLSGLCHKNQGRRPLNQKSDSIKTWYLDLFKEKYYDFNCAHAFQFICEKHSPTEPVSYSTFLKWVNQEGLGKCKKPRRAGKARIARQRMANEGLLLQMDGSPHDWNGEDRWTLIKVIDDATSKIVSAKFAPSETTWDCMDVLKDLILKNGIPEFILTDQAGWSTRTGKRAHFSQFKRACEELGITIIATSIPEIKGRVERSFRTSQDRLIAEMRLNGIKTMTDANRYLNQVYMPDWNERFAVHAEAQTTRYKPLPACVKLDEIFCIKHVRQVNRNHTVMHEGDVYKLVDPPQNLWKHEVTVHVDRQGGVKIFHGAAQLKAELFKMPTRKWGT